MLKFIYFRGFIETRLFTTGIVLCYFSSQACLFEEQDSWFIRYSVFLVEYTEKEDLYPVWFCSYI